MAVSLMWEGIDNGISSLPIEIGQLGTNIATEKFNILIFIYLFLQNIIIWDGLPVDNVDP